MRKITTPVRLPDESSTHTESFISQKDYWSEGEAYELTPREAAHFRSAILHLVETFNDTLDVIVADPKKYADLFLFTGNKRNDRKIFNFLTHSWQQKRSKSYIIDRWDVVWDGKSPLKLLERNFGHIGLITGTASVQEDYLYWLSKQDGYADVRSFGSLQNSFIHAFRKAADECGIPANSRIALTTQEVAYDPGMIRAAEIICRWIKRAGYDPVPIGITNLFFENGVTQASISMPEKMRNSWNWEMERVGHHTRLRHVFADVALGQNFCFPFVFFEDYVKSRALNPFIPELPKGTTAEDASVLVMRYLEGEVKMLQPFWSMLMSHKALLAIMYDLYPDHPNLLPTFFRQDQISGLKHVVKRVNSSQGIGSKFVSETGEIIASRHFRKTAERPPFHHIFQQYAPACEDPDGGFRVFHTFTSNGEPAALGSRTAPGHFVGGDDTETKYVPVLIRNKGAGKLLDNAGMK